MLGGVEREVRRKHQVPGPITTPRRGPLHLGGGREGTKRGSEMAGVFQRRPVKRSLNRLPLLVIQRPLDQIEGSLGGLSCAMLGDRLREMPVSVFV